MSEGNEDFERLYLANLNISELFKNLNELSNTYDEVQQTPVTFALGLCVSYGILFIFGLAGNLWVIGVVLPILVKSVPDALKITNLNMILYIFVLSVVDMLVLTNIPLLICDIYFNRWIFGDSLCKFYWIIESVNKLTSRFILAAMSLERYISICKAQRSSIFKSTKITLVVLLLVGIAVAVMTSPVYLNVNTVEYDKILLNFNRTSYTKQHIVKCVTDLNEHVVLPYSLLIFILGFGLPSSMIVYFYFKIIKKMFKHFQSLNYSTNMVTQIPVKKVTFGILGLILIYFVCWTPFWCVSLYAVLGHSFGEEPELDDSDADSSNIMMSISHLLVYVNSATNWVLYAYLNRNLKQLRKISTINNRTDHHEYTKVIMNRLKQNTINVLETMV